MRNSKDEIYIENYSKHKIFRMSSYHLDFLADMVIRSNGEPIKLRIVIEDIKNEKTD